jgi:hypothetical protein
MSSDSRRRCGDVAPGAAGAAASDAALPMLPARCALAPSLAPLPTRAGDDSGSAPSSAGGEAAAPLAPAGGSGAPAPLAPAAPGARWCVGGGGSGIDRKSSMRRRLTCEGGAQPGGREREAAAFRAEARQIQTRATWRLVNAQQRCAFWRLLPSRRTPGYGH